ncbi:MAG TPA: DUF721 domain-containing protein [Pyrinomonadaceae bacterium]|nr:DUF721 domain-containing protein [Pyrinomonadaceae bacterium]
MLDLFRTLSGVLRDAENVDEIRQAIVFASWRRIAGDSLAEHTVPLSLEDTTLVVAVSSITWQRHLKDLCGQMVFKLNAALGSPFVTFIELRVDENAVLGNRVTRDESELRELAEAEISPELRSAADKIEDEELRKQFLLAAGNCLVRRRSFGS